MSLPLENSFHSSSHMDYNLPYLRNWKGLSVVVCIWEIWSLHNLEMQLQHELAGLKPLWLLSYKYNESWSLNKERAFIIKQCQCCTKHKAATWTAFLTGCDCWHGIDAMNIFLQFLYRERLIIIIYLTFLYLSCWSVW